jgi:hypothetical protein
MVAMGDYEQVLKTLSNEEIGQQYLYTLVKAPHLGRSLLDIRRELEDMVALLQQTCNETTDCASGGNGEETLREKGRQLKDLSVKLDSSVVRLIAEGFI